MVRASFQKSIIVLSALFALGAVACAEVGATDPSATDTVLPAVAGSVDLTPQPEPTEPPESTQPPEPPVRVEPTPEPTEEPDPIARVWQKRIDRGMGDEPCTASPHELNPELYTGRLIDTHLHIPHMPDSRPVQGELTSPYLDVANIERFNPKFPILGVNRSISEIACTLSNEGTDGAIAFFPVFPQISDQSIELARRAMEQFPDLFFPFINAAGSGTATVGNDDLVNLLNVHPGLFTGYGEIPLYSAGGPGDKGLPPTSPIFDGIYGTAADHQLAVYFHAGSNQFDSLSQMLAENPNVNFILHGEQVEDEITDLMALHSNVYFTVNDLYGDQYLLHQGESTESFIEKISDLEPLLERDLSRWKEPIETYPDQFLWGTDRGGIALWTFDIEVGRALSDYGRAFISGLDPDVQERFAYKNALVALGREVTE